MNKKERGQLRAFGFAAFLNDLGAEMINPIWPLFLSIFLGASMTIVGLIDGIGDSLVSLSQFFSGYLSDRVRKRKVFIWLGYFFSSMSKAGYALARIWPQVIPLRVLDRSGKIRDAPRDAIIAEMSNHKNRGRNFGFLESMDRLGAVLGVIISIILFRLISYRPLFLLAAIPPFIAFLVIVIFVKEKKPQKLTIQRGIRIRDLSSRYKIFLFVSALFSISVFSYSFLLIATKDIGFSLVMVPVFYLIYNIFASASAIPFGRLADKFGRKPMLIVSYLMWILVTILFLSTNSFIFIAIAFALFGIYTGSIIPLNSTLVSELAPKKYKASALGIFKMITGIIALPASLIAGLLWQFVGISAPFYFSLFVSAIAIILLFFLVKENHNKD